MLGQLVSSDGGTTAGTGNFKLGVMLGEGHKVLLLLAEMATLTSAVLGASDGVLADETDTSDGTLDLSFDGGPDAGKCQRTIGEGVVVVLVQVDRPVRLGDAGRPLHLTTSEVSPCSLLELISPSLRVTGLVKCDLESCPIGAEGPHF